MKNDIINKANELAAMLRESDEYVTYSEARERALENETTAALINSYNALRMQVNSNMLSGRRDDEALDSLKHITEILMMNPDAAEYLMREYAVSQLLSDVCEILGKAVDIKAFTGDF